MRSLGWLALVLMLMLLGSARVARGDALLAVRKPRGGVTVLGVTASGAIDVVKGSWGQGGGTVCVGSREPLPSPDGSHLAFVREHEAWIRDLTTGSERRVTNLGHPGDDAHVGVVVLPNVWSPDGKSLVVGVMHEATDVCEGPLRAVPRASYGTHLIDLSSSTSRPLGHACVEAWLPDGRLLLSDDKSEHLETLDGKQSVLVATLGVLSQVDAGSALPIFVAREEAQGRSRIVKGPVGGDAVALTEWGTWAQYQSPRLAPAGRHVAWLDRRGVNGPTALVVDRRDVLVCAAGIHPFAWMDDATIAAICHADLAGSGAVVVMEAATGREVARQESNRRW